jgi:hypothetical protein
MPIMMEVLREIVSATTPVGISNTKSIIPGLYPPAPSVREQVPAQSQNKSK